MTNCDMCIECDDVEVTATHKDNTMGWNVCSECAELQKENGHEVVAI